MTGKLYTDKKEKSIYIKPVKPEKPVKFVENVGSHIYEYEPHYKPFKIESKVVCYGRYMEWIRYENPVFRGYNYKKRKTDKTDNSSHTEPNQQTYNRARSKLIKIIEANNQQYEGDKVSKFVTLTFRENIQDIKSANKEFHRFIKRLKYHSNTELKYVCVPERQQRGAIHYHVVFFNLPYIKQQQLSSIWNNGYVSIEAAKQGMEVGFYIAKYLSKSSNLGRVSYFCSRGLLRPQEYYNGEATDKVYEAIKQGGMKQVATRDYEGYDGNIEYTLYRR